MCVFERESDDKGRAAEGMQVAKGYFTIFSKRGRDYENDFQTFF